MKNVLAVALVVSMASIALSQNATPPEKRPAGEKEVIGFFPALPPAAVAAPAGAPAAVKQPQRWEYKVTDRGGFNSDAWEKRLNDMAKDGWELDQIDQGEGHYIFRRPVQVVAFPGGMGVPVFVPRPAP